MSRPSLRARLLGMIAGTLPVVGSVLVGQGMGRSAAWLWGFHDNKLATAVACGLYAWACAWVWIFGWPGKKAPGFIVADWVEGRVDRGR